MDNSINTELFDFIEKSPTAWHTAENAAEMLRNAGYTELFESSRYDIEKGRGYFVRRNGSALTAFRIPEGDFRGFMIMAAHGDSPSFRIKGSAETESAGIYTRLNVEKYGGMLCSSWLDRPLSVAGRVIVRENGKLVSKLVNIDRDLVLIPNVAIHMDRSANDGKAYNPNVDMLPLFSDAKGGKHLMDIVAEAAGTDKNSIVSHDLYTYCRDRGCRWGADMEYISCPRLDDQQCAFSCLKGFLGAEKSGSVPVLCIFDNEEVGSGTKQGADSTFLEDTLCRIAEASGMNGEDYRRAVSCSFMVSADNAHAVHPNHPEYADRNDRPRMNGGVVIKHNASQKYTTDAVSEAVFAEICAAAEVPVQSFTNRADMPGGSTLGNISTAHVSIDTVDIGLAQLAMHSAYETAGAEDTEYLVRAAKEFFSCSISRRGGEIQIIRH